MDTAMEKPGMNAPRYKVVERFGGWKIFDTAIDIMGTRMYDTKQEAERLVAEWEKKEDDDIEE